MNMSHPISQVEDFKQTRLSHRAGKIVLLIDDEHIKNIFDQGLAVEGRMAKRPHVNEGRT